MRHLISGFLLLLLLQCAHAQRFNAGIVIGANFSQIDGDYQFGFHKKGITAGARAIAYLTPWLELNIDLLYSQRGAQPSKRKPNIVEMDLNFAESLYLLNFKVPQKASQEKDPRGRKKSKINEFRPFQLQLGLSYGRLVNSRVIEGGSLPSTFLTQQEVSFLEIQEHLNKNDLSVVLGVSYFFSQNIGATFRSYIPTSSLYDNAVFPDRFSRSMSSYFISMQMVYLL